MSGRDTTGRLRFGRLWRPPSDPAWNVAVECEDHPHRAMGGVGRRREPPRELAQRYYTLASWAEHPIGGHFPAVAEPELLARTLRDAFRGARVPIAS